MKKQLLIEKKDEVKFLDQMNGLGQLDLSCNYYFINQEPKLKLVGCEGSFGSALIAAYSLKEELQPKKLVGHPR